MSRVAIRDENLVAFYGIEIPKEKKRPGSDG